MTTHIEAIAAIIDPDIFEKSVRHERVFELRRKEAIRLATLAFSMSAEICAEWHDNQECEAMKAHDTAKACGMGFTSTALREAERHKEYAAAIRALIPNVPKEG